MGELEPPRWLFLGRPKIKEQCWDPGSFPKAFLEPWGTLETSGVESGEPQESVDPSWRFGEGRMRRGALKKTALCVVFVRCWFGLSVLGGFFPHLEFSAPRFESVPPFLSLPAATPSRWKKGQFLIPSGISGVMTDKFLCQTLQNPTFLGTVPSRVCPASAGHPSERQLCHPTGGKSHISQGAEPGGDGLEQSLLN